MRRLTPPNEGLFAPNVRASDPTTSRVAAAAIAPKRGTMAARVLALLRAYPAGLTAREVESYLRQRDLRTGKMVEGWWKRLSDLKRAGLVEPTGETRDGGEVYRALTGRE